MYPKLIPQCVHHELSVPGSDSIKVSQRDCVENMVRNLFNLCFLTNEGEIVGLDTSRPCPLLNFYNSLAPVDRVSVDKTFARQWLDYTLGLDSFGVQYDPIQHGREVLTGVDNVVGLIEGMLNAPFAAQDQESIQSAGDGAVGSEVGLPSCTGDTSVSTTDKPMPASESEDVGVFSGLPTIDVMVVSDEEETVLCKRRALRLQHLCSLLSTPRVTVQWRGHSVKNYQDVALGFTFRGAADSRAIKTKARLLITTDHVCLRHKDELSC